MLHPEPPHDPRWLNLTTVPGDPQVRIDLKIVTGPTFPRSPVAAEESPQATTLSCGLAGGIILNARDEVMHRFGARTYREACDGEIKETVDVIAGY